MRGVLKPRFCIAHASPCAQDFFKLLNMDARLRVRKYLEKFR
jgi:hypothetical protein